MPSESEMESRLDLALHNGDALKILQSLPDSSVDIVLTDPPYASGGSSTAARMIDPARKYQQSGTIRKYPAMLGDSKDQRSWITWCTLWLTECWRVSKDGSPLVVFTDWRQLPSLSDAVQCAGYSWRSTIVWNKRSSRPNKGRFRQQAEFAIFASKGSFKPATDACLPGVFDYPVIASQKVHLTGKPVDLMQDLLQVSAENGVVLDPFMGGGTTGVAAMASGRKFVGIELSREYYSIAKRRIEAVQR